MALLSGKRLVWQAFAAGIAVSASLAAQPAMAVDDLAVVEDVGPPAPRPIEDEAAPPPRYYAPVPRAQRPYAPDVYERDAYGAMPPRPMMPPYAIAAVARSSGFMPLGPVARRGSVYTMAAAGRRGIEGQLDIDVRTGRVVRFTPLVASAYSPPGPPLYQQDFRRAPRPPASVPHVAKGNGTAPKVANQAPAATEASTANAGASSDTPKAPATHSAGSSPATEKPAAAAPAPLDKTAEAKPAATVGAVAAPATAPTASTLKLWPTQALPPVQPFD